MQPVSEARAEYAIEVRNLEKTYRTAGGKTFPAVRGLQMLVPKGSVYGFVGPNGAGKSTTIKILIGLARPSRGQATVLGQPCGSVQARQAIGYLPEVAIYHEFMGAEELLRVHAGLAGIPSSQQARKCRQALEMVSLWDRHKSRIREFSKGMKQRFGIAQALVAEPHLLILDELTSGLDPLAQAELRDLILELKARGHTIFFSSHKMAEVEAVSDHIGIIHKGKMRLEASKQDMLLSGQECRFVFEGPDALRSSLLEAGCRVKQEQGSTLWIAQAPRERGDELLDKIRGEGGSVLEFNLGRRHLEDIFLELTRSQYEDVTTPGGAAA